MSENEEIIKQINLTIQRVNEGSKVFRDQIDNNTLPAIKDNAQATQRIIEARECWTSADRETKWLLELAKKEINKSSTIHQVKDKYRYATPDWFPPYGNVFAKCALINKAEYSEEDFIKFIDWLAENNACNCLKVFLEGQWGYDTYDLIHLPHPYNSRTREFNIMKFNMEWWETILKRLHEIEKRKIRPIVITDWLVNNMHSHWLAQDRNTGWYGQKTYWDKDYGLWQWEEYADADPEALKEYREGKINRATAEEWIRQYAACRGYQLWRYNWIYSKLEQEFGKWIMYHHNEVPAGGNWHGIKAQIMDSHGIPKRRRITSTYMDFMVEKNEIANNYILDFHGVKRKEQYLEVKKALLDHDRTDPVIVSPDGYGFYWFKDEEQTQKEAEKEYRELLIDIHQDGNMYLGNEWWYNPFDKICDIEVLKNRLVIPNKILKEVWNIQ